MAGQSNMAGRGEIAFADTLKNERIFSINQAGELIQAKEPLHFYEPKRAGFDCGLSFGNSLLNRIPDSVCVLLVPTAVGGSSIGRWLNDSNHRGVHLLSNFQQKVELAQQYGTLKAILWHQGESDAKPDKIKVYRNNLRKLFNKFRSISGNLSLPIIMGELGSYSRHPEEWEQINEQIRAYADSDPFSVLVKTSDFQHCGDYLHFDAEGQREFGKRLAEAWLNEFYLKSSAKQPVVVLTFDDAEISHYRNVAPLLKQYGFGATFFVCEFPAKDEGEKMQYMNWQQIMALHQMGFEIGNHTGHHKNVTKLSRTEIVEEVEYIENKCREQGISKLVSFAYPGNRHDSLSVAVLDSLGYRFARAGNSRLYEPAKDFRLIVPSFTTSSDNRLMNRVNKVLHKMQPGEIMVLTFHGIPDLIHPDYSTKLEDFEKLLQYMSKHNFKVISLRDLETI